MFWLTQRHLSVCWSSQQAKFYNRYHLSAEYLVSGGPAIYAANFFEPKCWIGSNQTGAEIPISDESQCFAKTCSGKTQV